MNLTLEIYFLIYFLSVGCICGTIWHYQGEQGWRSGESARFPPMWPGFDSRTRRHMWAEFVVGSRPCSEGFSPGSLVFLPPQNPALSKFQFDREFARSRATGLSVARLLCATLVKHS